MRICACSAEVKSLRSMVVLRQPSSPLGSQVSRSWRDREKAVLRTSSLNWPRTCRAVSTPTSAANAARITNVSAADPPASRQRMGSDLYAENVARAADRMEEPRFTTGFKLPSQVGYKHLDGVGHREWVVAPYFVKQPLSRNHD